MAIRLGCGQGSIPGGASGGRIFLSASASALARFSDSAGAGQRGALIGAAASCAMAAVVMGFTVRLSTTATPTFMGITEGSRLTHAGIAAHAVLPRPGPEAMPALEPEDTPAPEPEALPALEAELMPVRARAHLADSVAADTRAATPREEGPASVAAWVAVECAEVEAGMAVAGTAAAGGNR